MTQGELFPTKERFHAFVEFHQGNPHVYQMFKRFAKQAKSAGRPRFGAHAIGERIRWYTQIETSDTEFKLNDHHLPYYARLLMLREPEFNGFFETRDARFDASEEDLRHVLP